MLEVEHTSFLIRKFNYRDVFRAPCFCIKEKKNNHTFLDREQAEVTSSYRGSSLFPHCRANGGKGHLSSAEPLTVRGVEIIGRRFSSFQLYLDVAGLSTSLRQDRAGSLIKPNSLTWYSNLRGDRFRNAPPAFSTWPVFVDNSIKIPV